MSTPLADLDPHWLVDTGRRGMGITFTCPCGCAGTERERRIAVAFKNPTDGGAPLKDFGPLWRREGETFEALTLSPSVDVSASGHWHGFVRAGLAE